MLYKSTTDCLQLGAAEGRWQSDCFITTGGAVCARGLVLASLHLRGRLQSVPGQVLAAGAEVVVERGGEAGDICGDVGKNLWRCLIIVTNLEKDPNNNVNCICKYTAVVQLESVFVSPVTCCLWSPVLWIQHTDTLPGYNLQWVADWVATLNAVRLCTDLWVGKIQGPTVKCTAWPLTCHLDVPASLYSTDPQPHGFLLEANKMKSWRIPEVGEHTAPWCTEGVTTRYRKSSSSTWWISSHFLI